MLALCSITVTVGIRHYTSPDHAERTAVFALPRDLLQILIVLHDLSPPISWQRDDTSSALHRTHSQLRQVVSIAAHCSIHVVG